MILVIFQTLIKPPLHYPTSSVLVISVLLVIVVTLVMWVRGVTVVYR